MFLTINLKQGLTISTLMLTTVFLMFALFQEFMDFYKNYLLAYMAHIPSSIIIPGLYFLTHPMSFKDSLMEIRDMVF